jgi:protoporphyrinogen/coproporphyrinogen III oxidase
MEADLDAVIVGGGIAGLSAALSVQGAGLRCRVLEASERVGGVIRTENHDGFLIEAGPDALLTTKPHGVALCRELGLGDRLVPADTRPGGVAVLLGGRLRPMPEGLMLGVPTRLLPMVTTSLFSWPAKMKMALEVLQRPRPEAADESIATFLRRHFGQEAVERVGEPLLAGIHAGDPERLSMSANFPRLVEVERRTGSLVRGLARSAVAPGAGPAFVSLRNGLQELVDAAEARLGPGGVEKVWPARTVRRDGERWVIEGPRGSIAVPRLVVALPPARAAALLGGLDAELATLLGGIRSVSTAVVYLAYRREDVSHSLSGQGLLVPRGEGRRLSAVTFVSSKFAGRAPEGQVLLRVFLGGARDPDVLERDDAALVELAASELRGILGLRASPTLTRVFRWAFGTPQLEVGHAARMAAVDERLARWPGLRLTGAGLRGTGIPDTIADATRQAAAVTVQPDA